MSTGYEYLESLGGHHPIEIEVTVAQAEERERRGIPLPISGDPETVQAKELLAIRRARLEGEAAAAPVEETEAAAPDSLQVIGHESGTVSHGDAQRIVQVLEEILGLLGVVSNDLARVVVDEHQRRTWADPYGGTGSLNIFIREPHAESTSGSQLLRDGVLQMPEEPVRESKGVDVGPHGVDDSSHNSSPSVGAPHSALRDNSNPTEGDPTSRKTVAL